MCALAGRRHMCASPCGPACTPLMWVCLSGDLCVDFEETDAWVAQAPSLSQNLSSGGPAPGAAVAQLRRVAPRSGRMLREPCRPEETVVLRHLRYFVAVAEEL